MENIESVSTSWHGYPKIYNLGHACIKELFLDEVIVEEKVDGSQFSFGIFNGEIRCKSKGSPINLLLPEKMFIPGIEVVKRLKEEGRLIEGYSYRAEYLGKSKHNALAYERIPNQHLIGFDINIGHETYLPY